ncbi:TIGR02270 family protein [Xenophilus arseniciresistens]|uniref:TIGR02270 family protein n=1 Tax=Xenophilus arseniciresistens TaxID=1283306 RepID=A0AAE3T279_9BURK|nr:TIGR02270 family protein [Xenophilus arseniciresistens]MDA7418776.1 TIGR02270 family protein [Xenophilus arseniciresistens]
MPASVLPVRHSLPMVVQQHFDSVDVLRSTRSLLVRAPHVRLHQLQRLDERIAASLDGLTVAGESGQALCRAALDGPTKGAMFAATVQAIEHRDPALLERLLCLCEASASLRPGLVSAFGWQSHEALRGIVRALADSPVGFRRGVALAACVARRVDPGEILTRAIEDAQTTKDAVVAAGRLGRMDLLPDCIAFMNSSDEPGRHEAARAGVLLGDRGDAAAALSELGMTAGRCQTAAASLALRVLAPQAAAALVRSMPGRGIADRQLLQAIAALGDPLFMPAIIERMSEPSLARVAGEAFTAITGVDLDEADLVDAAASGQEEQEAIDEDDELPWPDPGKVHAWWMNHAHQFVVSQSYLAGAPLSPAHCLSLLKSGLQRQRIAAAEWLCLLQPGTPLFNTAAPAWRQQRWLAQMGA